MSVAAVQRKASAGQFDLTPAEIDEYISACNELGYLPESTFLGQLLLAELKRLDIRVTDIDMAEATLNKYAPPDRWGWRPLRNHDISLFRNTCKACVTDSLRKTVPCSWP